LSKKPFTLAVFSLAKINKVASELNQKAQTKQRSQFFGAQKRHLGRRKAQIIKYSQPSELPSRFNVPPRAHSSSRKKLAYSLRHFFLEAGRENGEKTWLRCQDLDFMYRSGK